MTNHGIPAPILFMALDSLERPFDERCSITDGQQYDEWLEGVPSDEETDPDARYDEMRQQEIDELNDTLIDIARGEK